MGEKRTARGWAVATMLVTMLAASACSVPLPTPSETDAAPTEPSASSEPSATPEPAPTTEPGIVDEGDPGLSFADGADIAPGTIAHWADGFMTDDAWELTSPDDGQGNWGYTSADGTCVASFWQGSTAGVELSGDDRADSDLVIATLLGADPARVTEFAEDIELSYLVPGNGGLDARIVEGSEGDRVWRFAARAFAVAGAAVTVMVDCTGGDIDAAFAEVNEKNAVATM